MTGADVLCGNGQVLLTCARAGYSALSAATPPSDERGTEMSSQAVRVATPTHTSTEPREWKGEARPLSPLA